MAVLAVLLGCASPRAAAPPPQGPAAADLAGYWIAHPSHEGETSTVALHLEPGENGGLLVKWSTPAIDLTRRPARTAGSS